MVDEDNPTESDLYPDADGTESGEHQGPRRSTWAPPPSTSVPPPVDDSHMSDDDLASALEADFGRSTQTDSHSIIDETTLLPEPEPEPEPEPQSQPATTVLDEPATVYALDDVPLTGDEPDELREASGPAEPPNSWSRTVGTQAEPPPVRQSLPTAELAATLAERAKSGDDPGDIMAQLEEQLRLREHDATEFRQWQQTRVADGGSEALADVETARESFGDIVDGSPSGPTTKADDGHSPTLATHTFRVDEALESDLSTAPAPMTPPISDIPPPPGHAAPSSTVPGLPPPPTNPTPITSPTMFVPPPVPQEGQQGPAVPTPEPAFSAPPPIPDLVEPSGTDAAPAPFGFDALISGDPEPETTEAPMNADAPAQGVETGTLSDSAPNETVSDADQGLADLFGPFPVTSEGVTALPEEAAVSVDPIASSPTPSASIPAVETRLVSPRAFKVEESSVEPTPTDQRVGRAARLFWLWFAVNSSVVSVAFGGVVLSLGVSLRQAIVAALIGVSVSFLPLGLGTLAGKWSGQPTMIVSRATFGHIGNILPAVLALIVRVFWGAVLLWFLAAGTARILFGAELTGPLGETQVLIIGLAVGFLLALVIAFFGYGLIARIQMVVTIISALLIVGLIVITWPAVDIPTALTVGDGPWILVLTGAVLVFSFVGLVWAVSSADLARYQRASGSGASSMLWSTFGATIPAFVLIAYGAILAASNPDVASGLLETPLDTIALLIPIWYPIPLIAALAFSLLSGVVVSLYSAGFALQATGASMRRSAAVVVVGTAVAAVAVIVAVSVADLTLILRDVATSLAVPIAAWAGIFGAEMMIRSTLFSPQSLLKRGGVYADVRWVNLSMLLVASAIGYGLTTATVGWLSWQGYLFEPLDVSLSSDLAGTDLGVFVALIIGLLTPIVAGIPGIRRQEGKGAQRPVAADERPAQRG